ncbi:MAG TPA: hypothetical protein VFC15_10855, partial [Candidatus Limnocylindrales bacterium]|nr:hypothetical protein [Candidatus Limnocylindrales bacterium]
LGVDAMDLKNVLGDIQTDRGNLHLDGSPHVMRLQRSLYGTSMPGAGAVHHIKSGKPQTEHMFSALPPGADICCERQLCARSGRSAKRVEYAWFSSSTVSPSCR